MPDTPLTDDYVAEVLKRDALRKNQNRFVASGLGSLLSRPRGNAPKPNTRFLRNIVRDADVHNAALRRKEEEESRVRLKELKRQHEGCRREERSHSPGRRHRHDKDRDEHEKRRTKRKRDETDRSRSKERHSKRSRSRSPRRSSEAQRQYRSRRYSGQRKLHSRPKDSDGENDYHSGNDSDPLESAIGPKPPPKVLARGRGAHKDSSMDTRFDPSYDPTTDVALEADEEGDDWDMALEALRDRAKWRKSGGDRLRAAGFTDEEVSQWEKGGGGKSAGEGAEKDESNVRWSKMGESREWDRGKVVDGGRVDVKVEWGRLKDT